MPKCDVASYFSGEMEKDVEREIERERERGHIR